MRTIHNNSHMISVKFAERFDERLSLLMWAKARSPNVTSTYDFGEHVIENAKCQKQPFDISSSRVDCAAVYKTNIYTTNICICVHIDGFTDRNMHSKHVLYKNMNFFHSCCLKAWSMRPRLYKWRNTCSPNTDIHAIFWLSRCHVIHHVFLCCCCCCWWRIPAAVNVRYCARDILKNRTLTHKHGEERLISCNGIFYNGIHYFRLEFFLFLWKYFFLAIK